MKVKELIEALQKVNPEATVHMGYDSNIVTTQPESVEFVSSEDQVGSCWLDVKVGDAVILCDER